MAKPPSISAVGWISGRRGRQTISRVRLRTAAPGTRSDDFAGCANNAVRLGRRSRCDAMSRHRTAAGRSRHGRRTVARRLVGEGGDEGLPEVAELGAAAGGLFADGGVDQDEAAGWIDENRLAAHTGEQKHPAVAGQDPGLVAVAEKRRGDAGLEMSLLGPHGGRLPNPRGGDDPAAAPVAVVRQQQSEASVVAEYRVDTAIRRFLAGLIYPPRRVHFVADRPPDLVGQILGDRSADGVA